MLITINLTPYSDLDDTSKKAEVVGVNKFEGKMPLSCNNLRNTGTIPKQTGHKFNANIN